MEAPRALSGAQLEAWRALHAAEPLGGSPFLAPEFTLAVASERTDVAVGILEEDGTAVGFFPHQRGRFGIGRPVGGWLNDLQGVIAAPGVVIDARDLLSSCSLVRWQFTCVPVSQREFAPFHFRADVLRSIDLSAGFETYARGKRASFGDRLGRKAKKMEREVGPLRLELHNEEPEELVRLMTWKAARYRQRGYHDVFHVPWARRVIQRVHATQTQPFAGALSLLWAGKQVAAAHLGVRAGGIWHSWVVSYAREFGRYSPGLILYWKLAEAAPALGVTRIDLGGGDYAYKRMLANATIPVGSGAVDRIPAVAAAHRWQEWSAGRIRASRLLRPSARAVWRTYRRLWRRPSA